MADPKCMRCDGCGKIANSDSGEAWTHWLDLPPGSDLAVRMGIVRPVDCPECGGSGVHRAAVIESSPEVAALRAERDRFAGLVETWRLRAEAAEHEVEIWDACGHDVRAVTARAAQADRAVVEARRKEAVAEQELEACQSFRAKERRMSEREIMKLRAGHASDIAALRARVAELEAGATAADEDARAAVLAAITLTPEQCLAVYRGLGKVPCAYCHEVVDFPSETHWMACEKHPARARVADLEAAELKAKRAWVSCACRIVNVDVTDEDMWEAANNMFGSAEADRLFPSGPAVEEVARG